MSTHPEVPPSLLSLQKWFVRMQTRPLKEPGDLHFPSFDARSTREIEKRIAAGSKLSAVERMGLYNQQYWWRFFALLQEKYPALLRLFGRFAFNTELVQPYLLKYPPNHWSLTKLGGRFPFWVERWYRGEDRLLVLQMAQIEEAHERVERADSRPSLKKPAANRLIFLQPWVALFALDADFFLFRKTLLEHPPEYWEENDFPALDWSEKNRFFVLFRQEGMLQYQEILGPEWGLLKMVQKGATVKRACSSLKDVSPTDIRSWFEKWAALGWLLDD